MQCFWKTENANQNQTEFIKKRHDMWMFRFSLFSHFYSIIITVNHVACRRTTAKWMKTLEFNSVGIFDWCCPSMQLQAVSIMSLFVDIAITNVRMVFECLPKMKLKLSKCVIQFTIAVKPLVRIKSKGFNRIETEKYSVCKTNTFRTLSLSINVSLRFIQTWIARHGGIAKH